MGEAMVEVEREARVSACELAAFRQEIRTDWCRGELLGLPWNDVDLERGRLHLRDARLRERGDAPPAS